MLREFFVCGGYAVLEWMRSDPIGFFQFMLYRAPAVLLALILHEIAHGYVAYRCGDPTARDAGRLSLNPLRHLSLIGTLMMFLAGVGWAKPVPVNPNNLRHGRQDDFLVSIAGVTVNFILFTLATVLMCALQGLIWKPELFTLGAPLATNYDFLSFSGENFMNMLFSGEYVITEEPLESTDYLYQFVITDIFGGKHYSDTAYMYMTVSAEELKKQPLPEGTYAARVDTVWQTEKAFIN